MKQNKFLLHCITILIHIIDGDKCALYLWVDADFTGDQYGPFDVGSYRYGAFPNDAITSAKLFAQGYHCYADLHVHDFNTKITTLHAYPFGVSTDNFLGQNDEVSSVYVYAVATPNPTPFPSAATNNPSAKTNNPSDAPTRAPSASPSLPPTLAPSLSPTSSCLDYNNETSGDGDDQMRQFNEQHIINIDNYFMNDNASLVNITRGDYKQKLIECAVSDCIIDCSDTASCVETNIEINVQNKSALILCSDDYSCTGSTVRTSSLLMANISVVCVGKYSCINMDLQLTNISSFNLYCLQYGSCLDVNVTIDSNNNDTRYNDGIISCVSLNSCDNLQITTNSNTTQLVMYQHSEDVTLNNDAGYFYDYDNIRCNNDRYLRYETNMIATQDNITGLILDEYHSRIWPCQDVKVICGEASCLMSYKIDIPQSIDTLTSGCYWIHMIHFMRLECQGECVSSPTLAPTSSPTVSPTYPTNAPTFSPSIAPSSAPTKPPTANPSIAPTIAPSLAPTKPPTANPSISPTKTPTDAPTLAPSIAPSDAPSLSPSIAPSQAPSMSPTRYPTFEDIYSAIMDITYIVYDLAPENIELLEDFTTEIVPDITEILEANYFVENDIEYKDFAVNVMNVNGFEDLSNINLKEDEEVTIKSVILSKENIAGVLLKKSKSEIFEEDVTADLRLYFTNNSDLYFKVQNPNSLTYSTGENKEKESYTVIIISVAIVFAGFLCSVYVKWTNDKEDAVVDNAKWIAPLIFALQIYDFISDINLSYDILTNPLASSKSIILYCGVLSVLCTVIPFLSNLYYGVTIQTQHVIKNNKRAETYFTDKMALFLALIVCSAGCYPALIIVSSRIFNSDAFNSGLTKHELNRLSKIKMRSTITMENGPQLVISIIYSINIDSISNATFLSFVASSLSVILAVSSFYANKLSRKDAEIRMYELKFYNQDNDPLTQTEKDNIKKKKGRKQALEKKLAAIFGSSHENIEIGSVTVTKSGVIMFVSHHVPRSDLAKHNNAYNLRYNKAKKTRMRMVIGATQYLQHLYKKHTDEINEIFTMHFFEMMDEKFTVEFIMDNKENDAYDFGKSDSAFALMSINRTETIYGAQSIGDLSVEDKDNDKDHEDVEGNVYSSGHNQQQTLEMTEMKQTIDQMHKDIQLLMKHARVTEDAPIYDENAGKEKTNESGTKKKKQKQKKTKKKRKDKALNRSVSKQISISVVKDSKDELAGAEMEPLREMTSTTLQ